MFERSYLNKRFTVSDPDARLRRADDLMAFDTTSGAIRKIPQDTVVRVDDLRRVQAGAKKTVMFVHALAEDGTELGWTSIGNLAGQFVNETLDLLRPAPGTGQFGPNAAWSRGTYVGQFELVEIVDATLDIEHLAAHTVAPYMAMVEKAALAGVKVMINSGFRSYSDQKFLWEGFIKKRPGFNMAAKPGSSNHQNGIAFDIAVAGTNGNAVYDWLKLHAPAHGFVRTVNGEPWHWEYDPERAAQAVKNGTFRIPSVRD